MFTTEKEANTKRCQESFAACEGLTVEGHTQAAHAVVSPIAGAGNSYARHTAPSFCIGSGCMAWRLGRRIVNQDGRSRTRVFTENVTSSALKRTIILRQAQAMTVPHSFWR
jgi:hypothetical protein